MTFGSYGTYSFKKVPYRYADFEENCFYLKLFLFVSFKIYSITLDPNPELDQDPDPNSMYLDPQHWLIPVLLMHGK